MSSADDLLRYFKALPPEEQAPLRAQIEQQRGKSVPLPGPQTQAYLSLADVLLYGGQAGGGKSGLSILLAQEHEQSIIFRREASQTDGLERFGKEIYGKDCFNGQDLEWSWPDGRSLKLAGLKEPDSWLKHAGRARDLMCVAAGTPVLMANGEYRAIERLSVGDMILTLEGPHAIERVHPTSVRPCVQLTSKTAQGVVTQIQAANHAVLTASGWTSADDLSDVHRPIRGRVYGSTSRSCVRRCATPGQPVRESWLDRWRKAVSFQGLKDSRRDLDERADELRSDAESDCGWCCDHNQEVLRIPLGFCLPTIGVQRLLSAWLSGVQLALLRAYEYVRVSLEPPDFQWHCSSDIHPCDAQLLPCPSPGIEQAVDQRCLRRSSDVEQPSPNHSRASDEGRTQRCSRSRCTYAHPYTREIRLTDRSCSLHDAAFSFTPIGNRVVYDLQVEEVRHYITAGGIINRNCFDEAGEFLVEQVVSLLAWNRGKPGQRCRMLLASNPPRTAEGAWLIEWFAPWLEPRHPLKAKPGELRYAFIDPDKKVPRWVSGPEPQLIDGEMEKPLSFTFIPAALEDNPYTDTPEYRAKLNALPEPLRSQLKKGIFALGADDTEWQMIPSAWIRAAMDRWTPMPPDRVLMTALGADVAQGGGDDTTFAPRYDGWYDQLTKIPGAQTPGGTEIAGLVTARRKNGAMIILDVGGGWGADAYGHLRGNGMDATECVAYMGVKPSSAKSRDRLFHFTNIRSQLYWQFREALDPDQVGGSPIDLPPDNELLADLAAVEYEVINRGREGQFIKAEPKEDVVKKLGRSPNKGDAVVMSWYAGAKVLARTRVSSREDGTYGGARGRTISVDLGPRRRAR